MFNRASTSARTGAGRWAALAVLCVAALMVNLDNTILNVALPTLVDRLQATTEELEWIVDAYLLVFGGLLLVAGSLADRFGRQKLFIAGLLTFGGGSLGAAFSGGAETLIAWRAVMGLGAAMSIPAGLAVVNDIFRVPAQRARALSLWSGTIGLGIAIGPVIGGVLLAHFAWGSIFFVNVPVTAAGVVGALLLVPDSRDPHPRRPDLAGGALSILGLGLVLWAIIEGPNHGWSSAEVLGTLIGGVVVMAAFLLWERRSDHAMLPLRYLRVRRFSIAMLALALCIFGLSGGLFLQTQFLQFFLGLSPFDAGIRMLPIAAMLVVGAGVSQPAVRLVGTRFTVSAALLLITGGLLQIYAITSITTTYVDCLPGLMLIGLGAGLLIPAGVDSVLGSVSQQDSGVGSATNSTALQVGGALGVAVVGSVLSTRYQSYLQPALAVHHVPASVASTILGSLGGALGVAKVVGGPLGAGLASLARSGFVQGERAALLAALAVIGAGALLALLALPSLRSRRQRAASPAEAAPDARAAVSEELRSGAG